MPTEIAYQFLDQLATDPALRFQLQNAGTPTVQSVLDLALAKGFVFTDKELKSALAEYPDNPTVDQIRERLRVTRTSHTAQSGR